VVVLKQTADLSDSRASAQELFVEYADVSNVRYRDTAGPLRLKLGDG
jgi:hypothetical protein